MKLFLIVIVYAGRNVCVAIIVRWVVTHLTVIFNPSVMTSFTVERSTLWGLVGSRDGEYKCGYIRRGSRFLGNDFGEQFLNF